METEKIIELVKGHTILYDLSHPENKNYNRKDKLWRQIGEELNKDGETIKKKWKNLKDNYTRYIKCQLASKSGKKWVWAEQLSFLRPYLTHMVTNDMNDSDNDGSEPENQDILYPCVSMVTDNDLIINPSSPANQATERDIHRQERKKRKEPPYSADINYYHREPKVELDDVDSLFLAYAKTVKKFSRKRQAITKLKVAEVIMEQEILNLRGEQSDTQENVVNSDSEGSMSTIKSNINKLIKTYDS